VFERRVDCTGFTSSYIVSKWCGWAGLERLLQSIGMMRAKILAPSDMACYGDGVGNYILLYRLLP